MSSSFPPRTIGGAFAYCFALGLGYATISAALERSRER